MQLSHSHRKLMRECPFAEYMRYVLKFERDGEEPDALRIGSAIHAALEYRARSGQDFNHDTYLQVASDYYSIVPKWLTIDELMCEMHMVCILLTAYHEHYADDGLEYSLVEHRFETPIVSSYGVTFKDCTLGGVIDGVATMGGKTYLVEHKTTSMALDPDSQYWCGLEHDPQLATYLNVLSGMDVWIDDIIYDVIRKPSYRQRSIPATDDLGLKIVLGPDGDRLVKKNGEPYLSVPKGVEGAYVLKRLETPDEVAKRIYEEISENPGDWFVRRTVAVAKDSVDRCLDEIFDDALELKFRRDHNVYQRHRTPNCRRCEFCVACDTGYDPFMYEQPPVPMGYRKKKETSE